ncbi:MAG: Gfo/Idh/MocA family oxidoreductase, partial [Verrucomicrobiota bacterium]
MKSDTPATPTHVPNLKRATAGPVLGFNRRQFLKTAVQAGALLAAPQFVRGEVLGRNGGVAPSERIVLGGIGIGGRGTYDLGCFLEEPDVQFVAICDVKAARREAIKRMADTKYGNQACATYRDLRELLARSDIDAVLIATGPNWHATASILAANAGKDVYCEKPCTKNIAQSLALAETFKRTARVFQAGTQRRSLPNFLFAIELARMGKLGKLLGTRGLMPNPKVGTVTMDVGRAVRESKAGKVEFRVDKNGIIHTTIGRKSFTPQQLKDNFLAVCETLIKLKPATVKGSYIKSVTMSCTM